LSQISDMTSYFRAFLLLAAAFLYLPTQGQSIRPLTAGTKTSLRGLSAPDDQVVWASGSNGYIGKSTDGGIHWTWRQVPGFERTDFRDIEAFDSLTAVIMGISEPGYILRTDDGGNQWEVVYADSTRGVFMDAMFFSPEGRGIVVGDPIDGKLYAVETTDNGRNWQRVDPAKLPALSDGEAFFASSGGNVLLNDNNSFGAVTGGVSSKWLTAAGSVRLPLQQGRQSTGANAVAAGYKGRLVAVGGDFANDKRSDSTCAVSIDGGKTWLMPTIGLNGYRSSVTHLGNGRFLACGTSGVDISEDGGLHWKLVTREGFHVSTHSKCGVRNYLAGSNGRVSVVE
jgi:photosystem II stability/assembly factor-like uncharacterized protein